VKALTFHGPGDIRFEEVPDPRIERPEDVVVRVDVAGLCGSDLHPYAGREKGLDHETVMGHEFVGEVVAVGASVRRFGIGTRVVAPFSTSCGICFFCRSGLTSRCELGQLFGWREGGRGLHGGQAEFVRVPLADSTLEPVPDALSSERALFAADILPTGLFAAELGAVRPGTTVVVLGCGPVGLLAIVSSWRREAKRVLAIDSIAERLELAARFGAETLHRDDKDLEAAVRRVTAGRGADIVLEAVGSPQATRFAVDVVRPGGTVVAIGFHIETAFAFPPGEAYEKNLTYRAGRCPARRFMWESLAIMTSEGERLESIVSHRLPLIEGPQAYRLFEQKRDRCIKVALRP